MVERLPEDIISYAKHPFIIFGDGYTAQILSMKPSKDNDNLDIWDIIINPSQELIKSYNIRPGMPGVLVRQDGTMVVRLELSYSKLVNLNPDPSWNRWFCIQNFDGALNPAVSKLLPITLLDEIDELKQKIQNLKLLKSAAEEKLKSAELNFPKYMKQNVYDLINPAFDAAGKLMPNKPQQLQAGS